MAPRGEKSINLQGLHVQSDKLHLVADDLARERRTRQHTHHHRLRSRNGESDGGGLLDLFRRNDIDVVQAVVAHEMRDAELECDGCGGHADAAPLEQLRPAVGRVRHGGAHGYHLAPAQRRTPMATPALPGSENVRYSGGDFLQIQSAAIENG